MGRGSFLERGYLIVKSGAFMITIRSKNHGKITSLEIGKSKRKGKLKMKVEDGKKSVKE